MIFIKQKISSLFQYFKHIENNKLTIFVFVIMACITVFLFFPLFHFDSPRKMISLQGEWKISLNDSKEFSQVGYDDASWDTLRLPGKLIPYSIKKQNRTKGICWLRKTVYIEDSDETFGLILGRIANADETYINGHKIGGLGQFPPHEFSLWNYPRNYPIPDAFIKRGAENVIAVRVAFNVIGEIIGKLMITDAAYMKEYAVFSKFLLISIGYVTIGMGVILILTFMLAYLRRSIFDKYYMYFVQLFFGLFIILELCMTWKIFPNPIIRLKILGIAWGVVIVTHHIFLRRTYNLQRVWDERILWAHLIFCTIWNVFFVNETNARFYGALFIASTFILGFYNNISCHVQALMKTRMATLKSPTCGRVKIPHLQDIKFPVNR